MTISKLEFIKLLYQDIIINKNLSYEQAKTMVENTPDAHVHLSYQEYFEIITGLDKTQ